MKIKLTNKQRKLVRSYIRKSAHKNLAGGVDKKHQPVKEIEMDFSDDDDNLDDFVDDLFDKVIVKSKRGKMKEKRDHNSVKDLLKQNAQERKMERKSEMKSVPTMDSIFENMNPNVVDFMTQFDSDDEEEGEVGITDAQLMEIIKKRPQKPKVKAESKAKVKSKTEIKPKSGSKPPCKLYETPNAMTYREFNKVLKTSNSYKHYKQATPFGKNRVKSVLWHTLKTTDDPVGNLRRLNHDLDMAQYTDFHEFMSLMDDFNRSHPEVKIIDVKDKAPKKYVSKTKRRAKKANQDAIIKAILDEINI